LSGNQDPSKNNDRDGKREITININLVIKHFPLMTRWRSRWSPKRKPDPDSPDYDDTKPFRFDDDFRFRVDEFGDDDYFDEEGQS
tara:strand:- start:611 stop:865 length:255 start_codon:yes stop_codon:yes gene_type:complete